MSKMTLVMKIGDWIIAFLCFTMVDPPSSLPMSFGNKAHGIWPTEQHSNFRFFANSASASVTKS